jgi:HlyD family secretion protein
VAVQAVLNEERDEREGRAGGKYEARHVSYVYAVSAGRAQRREVTLGLSDDTSQEIVKGLAVGESIVVGPARILNKLQDGQLVEPAAPSPGVASAAGAGQ